MVLVAVGVRLADRGVISGDGAPDPAAGAVDEAAQPGGASDDDDGAAEAAGAPLPSFPDVDAQQVVATSGSGYVVAPLPAPVTDEPGQVPITTGGAVVALALDDVNAYALGGTTTPILTAHRRTDGAEVWRAQLVGEFGADLHAAEGVVTVLTRTGDATSHLTQLRAGDGEVVVQGDVPSFLDQLSGSGAATVLATGPEDVVVIRDDELQPIEPDGLAVAVGDRVAVLPAAAPMTLELRSLDGQVEQTFDLAAVPPDATLVGLSVEGPVIAGAARIDALDWVGSPRFSTENPFGDAPLQSLVAPDGTTVISGAARSLALAADGAVRWSDEAAAVGSLIAVDGVGVAVASGLDGGRLLDLDTGAAVGDLPAHRSLIAAGGLLYAHGLPPDLGAGAGGGGTTPPGGGLIAIDLADGTTRWSLDLGSPVTDAVAGPGGILALTEADEVLLLQ